MRLSRLGLLLALIFAAPPAEAQTMPVLRYAPPTNAYTASAGTADDFSFNGFNASVQVYPFRPAPANIVQLFETTLLSDWIDPLHREQNVGAPPTFAMLSVPGADMVVDATFAENIVGLPKPHNRMLIVAGGQAAIVDASAATLQSWQQAVPYLNAMAQTLRVEAVAAPPPLSPAAGAAVAGLYQGFKLKYVATNINITGYASTVTALHFYLFSADGRVYRAYDQLAVPGGKIAAFDFDAAARADPQNSGHYTVDGGKLIITMGDNPLKPITTDLPNGGTVTIESVIYQRK